MDRPHSLARFRELLEQSAQPDGAGLLKALEQLRPAPDERADAAALALRLGRPSLALGWARDADDALLSAAAACRLGDGALALSALEGVPLTARSAVLRARARQLLADPLAEPAAREARELSRREGDAPALTAAVTLLGEIQLARGEPRAALRTLAEGLKVAELTGQAADPHLLAVLALAQGRCGTAAKAAATATKALERSTPRSPARVLALLALGRREEARSEARAGELPEPPAGPTPGG